MGTIQPANRSITLSPAAFLAGFAILYFLSGILHLGHFPLNGDEPRRAVVSLEMIHSGNYIKPTTLGWDYYNKPPLYNWLIAGSMKLTGSYGEMAVRLPSLVFLMLWGFVHYRIARRLVPDMIAALSSMFLVTGFDMYFWGLNNGGEIDIFYSFLVYVQVISIFYFNQRKNWLALYAVSYAFCGLGLLTKGFPSVLFQGFTLLAMAWYNRSPRLLFRWQHVLGWAVFLFIAGGFFLLYHQYNDPFIYLADLLKEAFNKSALGEFPERLARKVAVYPLSFLKILLPWSLILLGLFRDRARSVWQQPLVRFSLLFILFNIAPYWFTGHPRMRYVYMFIPFSMLILAHLYQYYSEKYPAILARLLKMLAGLFVIFLAAVAALPFFVRADLTWSLLSALLLLAYLLFYGRYQLPGKAIWYFATGLVLIRLVYAAVFIPVKNENTSNKYPLHMAMMAEKNRQGPVTIYKKADPLELKIDLKLAELNFGTIPAIPYLAYQMPYYYYLSSGTLMTYDTLLVPGRAHIAFGSDLAGKPVDTLYHFRDPNQHNEEVILFRLKGAPQ